MTALANAGLDAAGIQHRKTIAEQGLIRKTFYKMQRQMLNDPADTFRVGGQMAFMTMVGGTVYGMAMDGTMTGGGPEQWARGREARKQQQAWLAGQCPLFD